MTRPRDQVRREAVYKMILLGLSSAEIVERMKCSMRLITLVKLENNIKVNHRTRSPTTVVDFEEGPVSDPPSRATLALAEFDPIIRRAVRMRLSPVVLPEDE